MHTCQQHGCPLVFVEGGVHVCPQCEGEDLHACWGQGLELPIALPADWVVPVEAEHPCRNLKPMTMRLEARDIERAKLLSKERGMPYQRYLRELITRALDLEEHLLFGPGLDDPAPPASPTFSTPKKRGRDGAHSDR